MTAKRIHRRDALRMGLTGLAAGGMFTAFGPRVLARAANPGTNDRKMLLIFLRGGWDGLNVAIPCGAQAQVPKGGFTQSVYDEYRLLRPDIHIDASNDLTGGLTPDFRAQPLPEGAGFHPFCELHPAAAALVPVYAAGRLAILHRIGYDFPSLSHFSAQQFVETAKPGDLQYLEGWVTLWAAQQPAGFRTASVSGKPMRWFNTPDPANVQPHIPRIVSANPDFSPYTLVEDSVGVGETAFEAHLAGGLANAFKVGMPGNPPLVSEFDELARRLGEEMLASIEDIDDAGLISNPYTPPAGVTYPVKPTTDPVVPTDLADSGSVTAFSQALEAAVALLKRTDASIVGVEVGGWDTHSDQGAALGDQQERIALLSAGMRAVHDDLQADTDPGKPDILTLAMSEFGRTSPENESDGTDHGRGGLMLAMGNCINTAKQVHNCNDTAGEIDPWTPDTFTDYQFNDKHMVHRTDFRAVLEEALLEHMQLPANLVDTVLPGYPTAVVVPGDPQFDQLNYLA